MELDDIQLAAQEQFACRSERYGKGHILENVQDVQAARRQDCILCNGIGG